MPLSANTQIIKKRVDKLVSRMTLAQKIGQMTQVERSTCSPEQVRKYHIGSVLSGAGSFPPENTPLAWLNMNEAYWQASMNTNQDQVAIPIIYGVDAIHGHNNVKGATIFPHNIGLGAANDPELVKRIARITAREMLATGVDWTFAPNLAIAQDNRWGRTYESFAETPAIVSAYADKMIDGLQGGFDTNTPNVIACVKHWIGDGGTNHGIDHGNTKLSLEALKETHIAPYHQAINAGVLTVMASFSSWNGDKCHGSHFLLTRLLKEQLKFHGFVVSDMHGIDFLSNDFYSAVALGVNAGIDMFMVPQCWQEFIQHLHEHIELGTISMSRINDAVGRIISVKITSGLFDAPSPLNRPWSNDKNFGSIQHRKVAREAVRKSMVLLKNSNHCLPVCKNARILVAGKNADNIGHQCGGFTVEWQGTSGNSSIIGGQSIWDGIKAVASNAQLHTKTDCELFTKKQLKKQFDLAVLVIGERPYAEGLGDIRDNDKIIVEAGSQIDGQINMQTPYGNSLKLEKLHPEDIAMVRKISSTGIPIVCILISGRPLIIDKELEISDAFIAGWLPGSEGSGVADVLFGDYNFQGKLSFTWDQQNLLQEPANHNQRKILFPYGYGLRI